MYVVSVYRSFRSTMPRRCRARSPCHDHHFEPITFGETAPAPIEGISVTAEDTEEDTDEVSSWFSSTIKAHSFSDPQIIGVRICTSTKRLSLKHHSLERFSVLSQVRSVTFPFLVLTASGAEYCYRHTQWPPWRSFLCVRVIVSFGFRILLCCTLRISTCRKEEKSIVEHTGSSFVLGRSGTGYVVMIFLPPSLCPIHITGKQLLFFSRCLA